MNKFIKNILLLLFIVLVFVSGAALGARYSLSKEMQVHEELLVQNLTIFADCKKHMCDELMQKTLIMQNDAAIGKYEQVESQSKSGLFSLLNQGIWPVIYFTFSADDNLSSQKLRAYYSKIGCGLDGVICHSK